MKLIILTKTERRFIDLIRSTRVGAEREATEIMSGWSAGQCLRMAHIVQSLASELLKPVVMVPGKRNCYANN